MLEKLELLGKNTFSSKFNLHNSLRFSFSTFCGHDCGRPSHEYFSTVFFRGVITRLRLPLPQSVDHEDHSFRSQSMYEQVPIKEDMIKKLKIILF